MSNSYKNNLGFSMLGIIIAIFITLIGIVGILMLVNDSLKGSGLSEMRVVAAGLAQEGVEIVRGFRREYSDWDDWYNNIIDSDYYIQYNSECLTCCPSLAGTCPTEETALKIDTSSGSYGIYQYNSGDNTTFFRKVTINKLSNVEVQVIVEVKWQSKGQEYTLTAEDRLWNWLKVLQ